MYAKKYKHKPHVCIYCKKEVARPYNHFVTKHKNEDKVQDALSEADKQKRYWKWKKLKQEGDNFYNNKIENVMGNKKVVKELSQKHQSKKAKRYFDCQQCQGRIRTTSKYKHELKCKKMLGIEAVYLKEPPKDVFEKIPEVIANDMRKNLYLGHFLYFVYEEKGKDAQKTIRTIITDLNNLQKKLTSNKSEEKPLVLFFKPKYIDKFIHTIKSLCQEVTEDNNKILRYPWRALRLCRVIRQLGEYLKVYYSKRDIDEDILTVTKFLNIFNSESELIIKLAKRSIKLKKIKNPPVIPQTKDIMMLIKGLSNETPSLISKLKELKNSAAWRTLAENVLCRLTIFNRRRGGAVEKMKLSDYSEEKMRTTTITEEAAYNLLEEEKKFLENIKIIEIMHKADNMVPIFINQELQDSMDVLLKYRQYADINKNNPYFFAASRKSVNPLSGVRAMEQCRLLLPESMRHLFTATNFRKHGATTAQYLNLTEQDAEEWASHMGHTIEVHKRYYRFKEKTNAILKTGRILSALDQGIIKYYKGKKIEEIPFMNDANQGPEVYLEKPKTALQAIGTSCSSGMQKQPQVDH